MEEREVDLIRDDLRLFELFTNFAYSIMRDYADFKEEENKELEI